MREQSRLRNLWLLLLVVLILVISHGMIVRFISSHAALTAGVVVAAVIIAVIAHLGVPTAIHFVFRRLRRNAQ